MYPKTVSSKAPYLFVPANSDRSVMLARLWKYEICIPLFLCARLSYPGCVFFSRCHHPCQMNSRMPLSHWISVSNISQRRPWSCHSPLKGTAMLPFSCLWICKESCNIGRSKSFQACAPASAREKTYLGPYRLAWELYKKRHTKKHWILFWNWSICLHIGSY